jgi:hypothetical protein
MPKSKANSSSTLRRQRTGQNKKQPIHRSQFTVKRDGLRLRNNEIGPVIQEAQFSGEDIHPANTSLCPWLALIASCFEQWRGHFKFIFKSNLNVTENGQLFMAIDRDPNDPLPSSTGTLMANAISDQCHIYDEMSLEVGDSRWRLTQFSNADDTTAASNGQDVAIGRLLTYAEIAVGIAAGTIMVVYDIEFRYPTAVNPVGSSAGIEISNQTKIESTNAQNYSPLESGVITQANGGEVKLEEETDGGTTDTIWERDIAEKLINYVFQQESGSSTATDAIVTPTSIFSNLVELSNTLGAAAGGTGASQEASSTWAIEPVGGTHVIGAGTPNVTYGGTVLDLDAPPGNTGAAQLIQLIAQHPGIVSSFLSARETALLQHEFYVGWAAMSRPHSFHQAVRRCAAAGRKTTILFRLSDRLLVVRVKEGAVAQAVISDGQLLVQQFTTEFRHDVALALCAFPRGAHLPNATSGLIKY